MTTNDAGAKAELDRLRRNPYPGRGLIIGRSGDGDSWLILYWIMGRSPNSRNRRFVAEGGALRTEPVDPRLVADPSLIIYEAMIELPGVYIVGNGDQTRVLADAIRRGAGFDEALSTCEREPDAPNFTPRITGMLETGGPRAALSLSLLRASPFDPGLTDRLTYRPSPPPAGFGYGLTTYTGDGHPLPSFSGDPLVLPLPAGAEAALDLYWDALNDSNRISLAVKEVPAAGGPSRILIRNRF